jgi:ABC-type nitrate/sulfonate/bicarbonate transport system permease component
MMERASVSERAGGGEGPARARAGGGGAFVRRALAAVAAFVVLASIWQALASVMPAFGFPPLLEIGYRTGEILLSRTLFADVLATVARIMAGLVGAFLLGALLASFMMRFRSADDFFSPILSFFQGIPALSWVVFAIIWFRGSEFRIFFIMVITTLPAFSFQVLGALRGMPKDLVEMVQSFRPSRRKMFTSMIFPAIFPDILTAWKVNIGNASRVVVVAELVGASEGIGYQLLQQQQLFDMAGALAWTLQIVIFVILVQQIIALIEAGALRYRATSERPL